MSRPTYVILHDISDLSKKKWDEAPEIDVNVEHVGAIIPRRSYTTLVVHGAWIHVRETREEVHSLLDSVRVETAR